MYINSPDKKYQESGQPDMDTEKTIPAEIIRSPHNVKIMAIAAAIVLIIALLIVLLMKGGDDQAESSLTTRNGVAQTNAANSPEMVGVEGGTAVIGTDQFPEDKNSPVRKIEMDDFHISKYEVTNRQYMEFIRKTGHQPPSSEFWPAGRFRSGEEDFPVVGISRDDASDYCRYNGMRLPTEEEWEFAARTGEGSYFPWGDEADSSRGNIASGYPVKVGESKRDVNAIGIHDLAGNVREWTSSEAEIKSQQGYKVRHYVIRGGSWEKLSGIENARFTSRGFVREGDVRAGNNAIGFRCVADGP
jgi:formylglycine-generating enzyme required for sulfatase activity